MGFATVSVYVNVIHLTSVLTAACEIVNLVIAVEMVTATRSIPFLDAPANQDTLEIAVSL